MRLRSIIVSLLVTTGFVLIGCGGGGGTPPASFTGGVKGKVMDISGAPLSGMTVYSGSQSMITADDGTYRLGLSKAGRTAVSAKGSGYSENSESFDAVDGEDVVQDIVLAKVDTVKKFESADGATVKAKGAEVLLPAGAYEQDGSSYSGKVVAKASYNRVTTAEGREAFPGTFVGQDPTNEDKVVGLQSYGFITVELADENGNAVQMKEGTATVKYPPDPTMPAPNDGDVIPLWYFDTDQGIWIKEGEATYNASTGFYEGNVTHFTTWNLDKDFNGGTINGCIVDASGAPVTLADLYVSAPGWIKSFENNDPNGEFELINAPVDVNITLLATDGTWMSNEVNITLSAGETYNMADVNNTGCLVLDQNASAAFVEIKGRVVDANNTPVSGQNVDFAAVDKHIFKSATSDVNGTFSMSIMRSGIQKFMLGVYYEGLSFSNEYTLDPLAPVVDVGDIVLATVTVRGCVTLENGLASLADGSVRDATTGRTTFGTYLRDLALDTPSGISGAGDDQEGEATVVRGSAFDENGNFEYKLIKDNKPHKVYAHLYDCNDTGYYCDNSGSRYVATGMIDTPSFSSDVIDLGSNGSDCIQLHQIAEANQSATVSINTTNPDGTVGVRVSFSDGHTWDSITDWNDRNKTVTFDIDRNGLYSIVQIKDWNSTVALEGSMTLETGDQTYTITIPANAQAVEGWMAFSIESYDGTVTVNEINLAW